MKNEGIDSNTIIRYMVTVIIILFCMLIYVSSKNTINLCITIILLGLYFTFYGKIMGILEMREGFEGKVVKEGESRQREYGNNMDRCINTCMTDNNPYLKGSWNEYTSYLDLNSIPSNNYNDKTSIGYSFLPPSKWYPTPAHPPVCITDKRTNICPTLIDGNSTVLMRVMK